MSDNKKENKKETEAKVDEKTDNLTEEELESVSGGATAAEARLKLKPRKGGTGPTSPGTIRGMEKANVEEHPGPINKSR